MTYIYSYYWSSENDLLKKYIGLVNLMEQDQVNMVDAE